MIGAAAGAATAALALTGAATGTAVLLFAGIAGGAGGTGAPGGVPQQWAAVLGRAAAESGVPGPILAAQLDAESGWNPTAVSPAGAQGIAQFMPGTWAVWGGDFDGDGDSTAFDPEDAIVAQGRFMGQLLRAATSSGFPGDPIDLALAGYNAGWGAVTAHRGVPPYAETRTYIARIRDLAATTYANGGGQPPPAGGGAVWPVDDPWPITNRYGSRPPGVHYALGYHTGIDLNNGTDGWDDLGATVRAARAGVVVRAGDAGALGTEVVIRHPDGYYSGYGHLLRADVAPGQPVNAGQPIGAVGNSGTNSAVPHLHLEVRTTPGWEKTGHIDPMLWLGLPYP